MLAARRYQNTAKVHFDQFVANDGQFKRRLIQGGYFTSLARALNFNSLANAFKVAAVNGGTHLAPTVACDTIYAWWEVLGCINIPCCNNAGASRLWTLASKDQPSVDHPDKADKGMRDESVILDFDYTVLIPRRALIAMGMFGFVEAVAANEMNI